MRVKGFEILTRGRNMVAAVRVRKYGGPEVLTFEDVEVGAPGEGQIRIKQHGCARCSAAGLPIVGGNA